MASLPPPSSNLAMSRDLYSASMKAAVSRTIDCLIPAADKAAYSEATSLAPDQLEVESDFNLFLGCESENISAAAVRVCSYWTLRRAYFGLRAFAPLTITSRPTETCCVTGRAALTVEEVQILAESGFLQVSDDDRRNPLVWLDDLKFPQTVAEASSIRARLLFYVCSSLAETIGCSLTLYWSSEGVSKLRSLDLELLEAAIPMRLGGVRIVLQDCDVAVNSKISTILASPVLGPKVTLVTKKPSEITMRSHKAWIQARHLREVLRYGYARRPPFLNVELNMSVLEKSSVPEDITNSATYQQRAVALVRHALECIRESEGVSNFDWATRAQQACPETLLSALECESGNAGSAAFRVLRFYENVEELKASSNIGDALPMIKTFDGHSVVILGQTGISPSTRQLVSTLSTLIADPTSIKGGISFIVTVTRSTVGSLAVLFSTLQDMPLPLKIRHVHIILQGVGRKSALQFAIPLIMQQCEGHVSQRLTFWTEGYLGEKMQTYGIKFREWEKISRDNSTQITNDSKAAIPTLARASLKPKDPPIVRQQTLQGETPEGDSFPPVFQASRMSSMTRLQQQSFNPGALNPSLGSTWTAMEQALHYLPLTDKRALLEAQQRVPELVARESDPERFLRCEGGDAWKAAQRLAFYWDKRKELFQERAFMSMKGEEILSVDDLVTLKSGSVAVLPKDNQQRNVLCLDRSKILDNENDSAILSRARALFYLSCVLAEDCMDLVVLVVLIMPRVLNFSSVFTRQAVDIYHAVPIRISAVHQLICPPKAGNKSAVQNVINSSTSLHQKFYADRTFAHIAASPQELGSLLKEFGLLSTGLPPSAGGIWKYEEFAKWIRNRFRVEQGECNRCSTLGQHVLEYFEESKGNKYLTEKEKKERKRKLNIIHSRQKRERRKAEREGLQERTQALAEENQRIRKENQFLEELLSRAMNTVSKLSPNEV